jgi:oligosaccharyltransferase complex subunit beta
LESFGSDVDGGTADAIVEATEKGGEGLWAGNQLGVVTGFQTLDGSRVTWLGGVDVLSNEYIQKDISKLVSLFFVLSIPLTICFRSVKSGNAQLARDIVAWTFQESLVLRIDKVEHHKVNTTESSDQYTVNDQLVGYSSNSAFELP